MKLKDGAKILSGVLATIRKYLKREWREYRCGQCRYLDEREVMDFSTNLNEENLDLLGTSYICRARCGKCKEKPQPCIICRKVPTKDRPQVACRKFVRR